MKEFNEIKEEIIKRAVDVADKTVELARKATDKTKTLARITRLTAEIANDKDVIKQNFAELGKLYYEKYKDEMDEEFLQLTEEIKSAEERIDIKKAEIEELKAANKNDDDVEVEFYVEEDECEDSCAETEAAEEKTDSETEAVNPEDTADEKTDEVTPQK